MKSLAACLLLWNPAVWDPAVWDTCCWALGRSWMHLPSGRAAPGPLQHLCARVQGDMVLSVMALFPTARLLPDFSVFSEFLAGCFLAFRGALSPSASFLLSPWLTFPGRCLAAGACLPVRSSRSCLGPSAVNVLPGPRSSVCSRVPWWRPWQHRVAVVAGSVNPCKQLEF